MEETIAEKALRILREVPEDEWITDMYTDGKSRCCAIGHYTRLTSDNPNDYSNTNCREKELSLREVTGAFINKVHSESANIACVNNYPYINGYTEPVIKHRVIHLLEDMVAAGY